MALVLFDWDGTLAEDQGPDKIGPLLSGASDAVNLLHWCGHEVAVVTNQGPRRKLGCNKLTDSIRFSLRSGGCVWEWGNRVFVCFHSKDEGCDCRKPAPGLLIAAERRLGWQPSHWMVGDKWSDMLAAQRRGQYHTVLVNAAYPYEQKGTTTPEPTGPPDFRVETALDAAKLIVAWENTYGEPR